MDLVTDLRNDFDEYFKEIVLSHTPEQIIGLRESVSYHFGWNKIVSLPGKRLRPLFLLLTYCSFGGAPQKAYNPAVALEVLHNYTLVHDDIEDGGETRHGQPALWVETGMPLAINVGDYLASLSHTIMSEISEVDFPPLVRKRAIDTFQQASLEVIQGQQLDITYENYPEISVDQYLEMIRLKTSRLFASAMTISARLQNLDLKLEAKLEEIGEKLGLGFQIQDDYLGIWGQSNLTGKSVSTDLLTRKKTYPALIGLERSYEFGRLWKSDDLLTEDNLNLMKKALEDCGAMKETLDLARTYYKESVDELALILSKDNPYGQAFINLLGVMFAPSL